VIAGTAIYARVHPLLPPRGARIAGLERMQVSPPLPGGMVSSLHQLEFEAAAADVVGMTNRYPLYSGLNVRHATANGVPAELRYSDGRTMLYACAACQRQTRAHWRIELDAVPENIDVTVLLAGADTVTDMQEGKPASGSAAQVAQ
jgi:hypothetical protein